MYQYAAENNANKSEPNTSAYAGDDWHKYNKMDVAIKLTDSKNKIYAQGRSDGYVWLEFYDFAIMGCYVSRTREPYFYQISSLRTTYK